jgi:hypothetical protein
MSKKLLSVVAIVSGLFVSNGFAQQPPNASFETWTTDQAGEPEPSGYGSSNVVASFPFGSNSISVTKNSTKVHSGSYSMEITTQPYSSSGSQLNLAPYLPDGALDFAFTGTLNPLKAPYFIPGYPEVNRYAQLSFYAEYTPVGSDVASCGVALTKWNTSTLKRDTIATGFQTISGTVSSFTEYTITLTYKTTEVPDTGAIFFISSGIPAQVGSSLIVDDVSFSGTVPTGIHEYAALSGNITAFPNPASESITLKSANTQVNLALIEIFDVTGRRMDMAVVQNNQTTLNTEAYAKGLYIYSAYDANHQLLGVGKFNIIK